MVKAVRHWQKCSDPRACSPSFCSFAVFNKNGKRKGNFSLQKLESYILKQLEMFLIIMSYVWVYIYTWSSCATKWLRVTIDYCLQFERCREFLHRGNPLLFTGVCSGNQHSVATRNTECKTGRWLRKKFLTDCSAIFLCDFRSVHRLFLLLGCVCVQSVMLLFGPDSLSLYTCADWFHRGYFWSIQM